MDSSLGFPSISVASLGRRDHGMAAQEAGTSCKPKPQQGTMDCMDVDDRHQHKYAKF